MAVNHDAFVVFFNERLKGPLDGLEGIRKAHIRKMLIKLGLATMVLIAIVGVIQTQGDKLAGDAPTLIGGLGGAGWLFFVIFTLTRSKAKFSDGKIVMRKIVEEIIQFIGPRLTLHSRDFIKPEDTNFADMAALQRGANNKVKTYFCGYRAENLIKGSYNGLDIEFCVAQIDFADDKMKIGHRRHQLLERNKVNITHSSQMGPPGLEKSNDGTTGAEYTGSMVFKSKTVNTSKDHVVFVPSPVGILDAKPDKTHLVSTGDQEFDKKVLTYTRNPEASAQLLTDPFKQKLLQAFDGHEMSMTSINGDLLTIIYTGWPGLFHVELGTKMNKPDSYLARAEYLDVRFEKGYMLAT